MICETLYKLKNRQKIGHTFVQKRNFNFNHACFILTIK